ncbi:MAG: MoaD/ThiS family protein [Candidatus Nitrosotenuis sp.]|uniref:Putative ThiS family protein n=1 Tax=Candidatus Nitrosotenuis uzonensis TaxID=1407055 RepID=V6AUG0_9ARCH
MITIKLLGGARKSFDSESIILDVNSITIGDLLEHLLSIKPNNTLDLDTKNILVAVNGIDSSALEGRNTLIQTNDTVSIIPVIHGGA